MARLRFQVLLLVLAGCTAVEAPHQARYASFAPKADERPVEPAYVSDEIRDRIFCLGPCPRLDAAAPADELVLYRFDHTTSVDGDGRAVVRDASGERRARLDPRTVRDLVRRFESVGSGLEEAPVTRGCFELATDIPTESMTLRRGSRSRALQRCDGPIFVALADAIDRAVANAR